MVGVPVAESATVTVMREPFSSSSPLDVCRRDGVGTSSARTVCVARWLPGLHRAVPSAPLDERYEVVRHMRSLPLNAQRSHCVHDAMTYAVPRARASPGGETTLTTAQRRRIRRRGGSS